MGLIKFMGKVRFDPGLSIGSVLNFAVILVAAITFWVKLDYGQKRLDENFNLLKAVVNDHNTEIKKIQLSVGELTTKHAVIANTLEYISSKKPGDTSKPN